MEYYLSYLMGGKNIKDNELTNIGIEIVGKSETGSRKLKIPQENIAKYIELIKTKLTNGYWNEVVGNREIKFIFKLPDGTVKEYTLSPQNEAEIDKLCAKLNKEPPDKTANVYKYISENNFYHEFMVEHYSNLINR